MNHFFIAKPKIIAIPFAGGNQYSFKTIEKYIQKDIEWVTVELPGRGGRFSEQSLDAIHLMVADLFDQILPHIKEGPYMIYGHSMGTLLGYELTKKIVEAKMRLPKCLFFTGRSAPSVLTKKKRSILPKTLFWKEVYDIGGLPTEILDNKDLLDLYYPILKSDFKAIEDYEYITQEQPFSFPIYVCMGTEEVGEDHNQQTIEEIMAWDNETKSLCGPELLEGDHFFILKSPQIIAQKIVKAYRTNSVLRTSFK
ncbi:hypothetical protein ATO12_11880 [Aquimarina atlantica]|uniref:Thioesterase domain-containing protein n=1 Tax=Aquimarina atlantica TaxID=1317122 RepID=A0A023BWN1_9FLAO|nr:thioesterase domain-containing protein [Aquimarina atlantica]EZH74461.1 hypothetical protein ATO12_11880 [Aquimarina atlantica]